MILKNLQRAAELIQSFKQVAVDQSSEERRVFPVKAYLEEVLLSLHPKIKRTHHTVEIHAPDDLALDSYPGAFSQIVTNLVMNSLVHAYEADESGHLVFDLNQRDGYLIFEYADDGKGISKENLGKIFDPFFTTKRGQGGSGLGLHIIYNLVTQKLDGTIRCESAEGRGTRFLIEVPISGGLQNESKFNKERI
jgi:signal transduction histidine kinase